MLRNHAAVILLSVSLLAPSLSAQQQMLREAARLDQEGKCDEAEPYYQRALAAGAPSPALLNNVGIHYVVCGQPDKAQSYFQQLLKRNPAHTNANLQLARIATDRKQGAKALEYLSRVNESGPAVLLLRAEALHWAGKRDESQRILNDLETKAGGDPRILFTLGLTCARIGLYDHAENAFSAVLAKLPGNFDVLLNLGRAAARAEHYERAQSVLEVALKTRPNDVDALFELGLVYAARQDSSRAVFLLAQARKQAPKRPDILLALARASEDAEYYGDAALAYDEYLKLRPGDDIARRDRAFARARTEVRQDEGRKELERYVKQHPNDPIGHYNLAHLSWETAPEEALDQLAAAVRLDPELATAHVSRGWLLHRLGRSEEAVPHLEAAIRLQPNSLRALDQLGLIYLAIDKPSEAEKVLRKALAISADDPEVLLHMGRTLMALEREEEAERYLDKFRKVRPPQGRDHGKEARMIELASLPAAERRRREIERFRKWSRERPDEAEFQLHLANLLLADGQTAEAVTEFRNLLTKPANTEIREQAGKSLLRVEQYELARKFLEQAVAERPSARLDLATALFYTEGPERALEVIEEAPDGEQTGDYLLMKARILDAAGRWEEADKVLREGLRHTTARPDVVRQAALLLARHNRGPEALGLLDRAGKTSPDDPDLALTKAIVLGLDGRHADAEEELLAIEVRWPEWHYPHLVHGLVLESRKRPQEARRKIQTAIALGSVGPAAKCALARLNGEAAPDSKCDCLNGLREVVFPSCE